MHFAGVRENSSKPGDSPGETTRSLFENQIQKLFFLCIKTSDFLKQ